MSKNKHPEQDPAEGSRETIERELSRKRRETGDAESRMARDDLAKQVKEETELPQKGAP
jgi:hypothetical protein